MSAFGPELLVFELVASRDWDRQLDALRRTTSEFEDVPVLAVIHDGDDGRRQEATAHGASNALLAPDAVTDGFWLSQLARSCVSEHGLNRDLERVNDQLVQVSRFLERSAVTDPLTGLLNRRGLRNSLAKELKRASRHGGLATRDRRPRARRG